MFTLYILLFVSFIILVVYVTRRKKRLPPGPIGLPIIGNLLSIDPKAPHESMAQLAWKYGHISSLWMGSIFTVILSDPKLVRQAYAKDTFTDRARLYLTHGIMKGQGIIAAEGELWREHRKFVAGCLKNFGMARFASPRRNKLEERILIAVEETLVDTQIKDYDIPKGTMVLSVLWAIHLNPLYWPDPNAFKPARFISEDGSLKKPDAFFPFQCGKRMCIGDELARMMLFLFSARILQKFSLSAPLDHTIDLEGQCGITLVPKSQRIVFKKRR
ncbi:cytochrome P450 306a1-like [Copidosoma floridanum]|uniref:cytochrome P450 306a1-like n=1 Tax=Copidosoma floridanum TaxID=29053 RepID=UPI000C6F580D|nr:cytochrome P450 306a1-like [Copidosoma floridanum]